MSTTSTARDRLRNIDPYEFEEFVADLWEVQGWDAEVTQASNDMGVDVVATKHDGIVDQKLAIQVKRYSEGNKIGRDDVQQYHSMKVQDASADAAVIVTTSSFTSPAEDWAAEHNIKLVDVEDIIETLESNDAMGLLEEYAPRLGSGSAVDPADTTSSESVETPSVENDTTFESSPPMPAVLADEDNQQYLGGGGIVVGLFLILNPTGLPSVVSAVGMLVVLAGVIVWQFPEQAWERVSPTRIVHHEYANGAQIVETDDDVRYEPANEDRVSKTFAGTDQEARQRAAVYGALDTNYSGILPETDPGSLPTTIASQGPVSITAYRYAVHGEAPAQIASEMGIGQDEVVDHIQSVVK